MEISELHLCYTAFVNLYGVIYSDYIYEILKGYNKDITKTELSKDLKSFENNEGVRFDIYPASIANKYVLVRKDIREDEIEIYLEQLTRKPLYIPETFEDFMKYTNKFYWIEENDDLVKRFNIFLKVLGDNKESGLSIQFVLKEYIDTLHYDFNDLLDLLKKYNLEINGPRSLTELAKLYQELLCKVRLAYNCGYTAIELVNKLGIEKANELNLFLLPNIKEMLMDDNKISAIYFLAALKLNAPINMKTQALFEINEFRKAEKTVEV